MSGNWIPFGVVIFAFGIVVWMFIFILKEKEKGMNEKHDTTNDLLKAIVSNQNATEKLMERVTVKIEQHDIEIRDLKRKGHEVSK